MTKKHYPKPADPDRDLPFELDLADDFRQAWPDHADRGERDCSIRGQLVQRVHWDHWGPNPDAAGLCFDQNKMVKRIIDEMEEKGAVGYAWAIVRNGQLVDAGGIGDARTPAESDPRKMTETTRMVSASLAKPVCALAIMKLVEDGELSLDEKAYPHIAAAFPVVDASVKDITIRNLLTHKSGIDGAGKLSSFGSVLQQPLAKTPGTSGKYENANYWFLAYVVEGVTGAGYVDFAQANILDPMTITTMSRDVDPVAPCLHYDAGAVANGKGWGSFSATAIGAYGWYASAIDWAKLLAYFRFDQVLSKTSRLTMLNAKDTYFGFRHWFGQERGTYYGHGGDFFNSGGAFHGGIMGFPDGIDAVLLTNSDDCSNPESVLIKAYNAAYE